MDRPRKNLSPVPPQPGADGADDIDHHVPRVARGASQQMRADDFKEDRPENRVKGDFAPGGRVVHGAEAEPALQEQERRQRAGHEKHVVEVEPQEGAVNVRFEAPAIQRVKRTANHEQTITNVPEFLHNKAMIA
jgi:hypothetical protein